MLDLNTRFEYAREAGRLEAQAVTGNSISIGPLSQGWDRFKTITDDSQMHDIFRSIRLEALDDCKKSICSGCHQDAQTHGAFMERNDITGVWTHLTANQKLCLASNIRDYEYQQRS